MHLCDNGKIYFLDVCTPATTEKIYFNDVCTPAATEKIHFFDVCTPAATEKIHFLDVCTLATTEKYIFSMDASLQQRKNIFSRWMHPCSNGKMYSRCCKWEEERTFF